MSHRRGGEDEQYGNINRDRGRGQDGSDRDRSSFGDRRSSFSGPSKYQIGRSQERRGSFSDFKSSYGERRASSYGSKDGDAGYIRRGDAEYDQENMEPAPMPGEWEAVELDDKVPSWDPDCLPEEERGADWRPPTPPLFGRSSLMPFKEMFEEETEQPPRVQEMDKEKILRGARDIKEDEPLVLFNNSCVVSTTIRGIKESKRLREMEDREDERGGFGGGRGGFSRGRGFGGGRGGGRGRDGGRGGGRGGFQSREERGEEGDPNLVPVAGERRGWGGRDTSPARRESRESVPARREAVARENSPAGRDRSPVHRKDEESASIDDKSAREREPRYSRDRESRYWKDDPETRDRHKQSGQRPGMDSSNTGSRDIESSYKQSSDSNQSSDSYRERYDSTNTRIRNDGSSNKEVSGSFKDRSDSSNTRKMDTESTDRYIKPDHRMGSDFNTSSRNSKQALGRGVQESSHQRPARLESSTPVRLASSTTGRNGRPVEAEKKPQNYKEWKEMKARQRMSHGLN